MTPMNETFRISKSLARQQLMTTSVLTMIIVAFCAYRWEATGRGGATSLAAIAMIAVIGAVVYGRQYKRATRFAANHELVLTKDAIVLRDGETERRVPYESIEKMKIRHPPVGKANFTLEIRGVGSESYYGYEEIDRLIADLARQLPRDRVVGESA